MICEQSCFISVQFNKVLFFFISFFGHGSVYTNANMSNEGLFVELKEVVNYAVSFFRQKNDELRPCLM